MTEKQILQKDRLNKVNEVRKKSSVWQGTIDWLIGTLQDDCIDQTVKSYIHIQQSKSSITLG